MGKAQVVALLVGMLAMVDAGIFQKHEGKRFRIVPLDHVSFESKHDLKAKHATSEEPETSAQTLSVLRAPPPHGFIAPVSGQINIPMPYAFKYEAANIGGTHGQEESADGSGRVIGSYTIHHDDGHSRIVNYVADEQGFRADVITNEPGTESKNPADVTIQSSAVPGPEAAIAADQQLATFSRSASAAASTVQRPVYISPPAVRTATTTSTSSEHRADLTASASRNRPYYANLPTSSRNSAYDLQAATTSTRPVYANLQTSSSTNRDVYTHASSTTRSARGHPKKYLLIADD